MARGMDLDRLRLLAETAAATIEREPPGAEIETALRDNRAQSAPCAA